MSVPTPTDAGGDTDVAVVGYGPVGNVLAILLGAAGHRVTVLERQPNPYPLPRAVHFDHEVGRILAACGIGDDVRAISEPAEVYEWRNARGETLLRFGRIGAGLSGWPQSSMVHQPALEARLDARARSIPGVEVRRGVTVAGIEDAGDAVVVRDDTGGGLRARWAVGCDGANSTVRALLDLPVHDLGFFHDWLIVDVVLDEPRVFDPVNVQICDPARPTTMVSGGPGRRRWEFMRLPGESREALDDERRAWELLADWDVRPDNARLERHAVYTFQARYAERWRAGRVLVAGDAAHLMPPFAGQGMCAGLRDAINLAWKLDLVLRDLAPDSLLDTYTEERMDSARTAIEFSMELGKVICVPDPAEAAARDEAMIAARAPGLAEVPGLPGISSGLVAPTSPGAGTLFVQGRVRDGWFDDVAGVGWRLVTCATEPLELAPDVAAWFDAVGGRVVRVTDDPDGTYAGWFADHGTAWALQRPDFHLYGTAVDAAGAASLLTELRAHLADPRAAEVAS